MIVGRPPQRHWRLPADSDLTVLTNTPASENWYRAIHIPDLTSVESALCMLFHHGAVNFDTSYSDYEPAIVPTALLSCALGCAPAVDHEAAVLGRDKYLQKQRARARGIPVTDVELIPPGTGPQSAFRPRFPYPVIIKPALGFAGRAVTRVDSDAGLARAVSALPDWEPYICERFVTGTEIHVDAIVTDGQPRFLSVARYLSNVMDMDGERPAGSVILPEAGYEDLYAESEELLVRVLSALGHRQGAAHMEAFITGHGLVFSEIGLRRGGGRIAEAIELAAGVDLRELSCLAGLRCLPWLPVTRPSRLVGWFLVTAGPGRIVALPDDSAFADIPGARICYLERGAVGRVLGAPANRLDAIGYCTVTGATLKSVLADVARMARRVRGLVSCAPA